ncbi:MAG: Uma2 family endonuclease [Gemmatimonadales bacterium]|jgi:Uma2 family endonuclease|nr:MAG: Uma2 family endonuclease [Gemmatimonadales bacterium]
MPPTLTTRRFTVDEYYRMAEAGILGVGERVELIDGEIVQMAAIGSRHAGCVKRLLRLFVRGVGDRAIVQVQDPVRLSDLSEPQPDLAVLRPRTDDYTTAHPGPDDVLLVVEVADATVEVDRGTKAPLYAAAGIGEYWLVDLPHDEIQVFRTPTPDGYRDVRSYRRGDVLRPSALPGMGVPVADILP